MRYNPPMNQRKFTTPMMQQYVEIKKQYQDCLLFFRLGDFYELFLDDAIIGAEILGITLTARPRGKDGDIPMAGVPYHSATSYINKLIQAGHKIAICEQTSPAEAGNLVDRDVVRIITPGTVLEESSLDHKHHNFIACLAQDKQELGLALVDLSTGQVFLHQSSLAEDQLQTILDQFNPKELILSAKLQDSIRQSLLKSDRYLIFEAKPWLKQISKQTNRLFKKSKLTGLSLAGFQPALLALTNTIAYLEKTQFQELDHLQPIQLINPRESLMLDNSTLNNLELFQTIRDQRKAGSLIQILDQTQTAMGGRLLRLWLKQPLTNLEKIEARQSSISYLLEETHLRQNLEARLSQIGDLERLTARLSLEASNPKDLLRLKDSLEQSLLLKDLLSSTTDPLLQSQNQEIAPQLKQTIKIIQETIRDSAPTDPAKGQVIQTGINQDLDHLQEQIKTSKDWIAQTEQAERQRTGISSLKIKCNKVFGYYIEISKANLDQVPDDYQRKQTLVNAERFFTPELKHHEEIILTNQDKATQLEQEILTELINQVLSRTQLLQQTATAVAQIDCLLSLTLVAWKNGYHRPEFSDSGRIEIEAGRHPVIEQLLDSNQFVPNDTKLDPCQLWVITGPNMAGKSVYMRQVALLCLLAQTGSFIPAKSARLTILDRIFVRSGASDMITQGLSTFMVEMTETAFILSQATKDSLVIMDEIGRGTTTYDGISIAWAVAEYLVKEIGAKTLFATHYHELQNLEDEFPEQIANYYAAVEEHQDKPVFIHRILEGKAQSSFGIAVAQMAGVPESVIASAQARLRSLESLANLDLPDQAISTQPEPPDCKHLAIQELLEEIDLAQTTPLEALNILAKVVKELETI